MNAVAMFELDRVRQALESMGAVSMFKEERLIESRMDVAPAWKQDGVIGVYFSYVYADADGGYSDGSKAYATGFNVTEAEAAKLGDEELATHLRELTEKAHAELKAIWGTGNTLGEHKADFDSKYMLVKL